MGMIFHKRIVERGINGFHPYDTCRMPLVKDVERFEEV